MEKENQFKIIVPSYNNEQWVEYNIASILNQTYSNYEVLYIDDASTDNTLKSVISIVGDNPKFTIKQNSENRGAAYNYTEYVNKFAQSADDIIIHLDGDDWLFDEMVLERLNAFYNEKDCWMTYGGFVCYDGTDSVVIPNPQSTPHEDFVHNHKLYRRDAWRASHLRTYRAHLFNAINKSDLKSRESGEYYWHAIDLAWQYPCMEMCGKDKIGVVNFYTCVYNQTPKNQTRTREREHIDNSKYELEIRNKKTYKEGLTGEKLPQINVFYDYMEYWTIPEKFTYCYEQTDGEYDMVLIGDDKIEKYLRGEYAISRDVPIVARLMEHRSYFQDKLFALVRDNYDKFHTIFTHDKELLQALPNAKFMPTTDVIRFNMLPNPSNHPPFKVLPECGTYEMPDDLFKIYPKTKLVSVIASNKTFLPGHVARIKMLESVKDRVDVFGSVQLALYNKMLRHERKFESLRDYAFSIAIENLDSTIDDYYFSEKITDCFITGTVPIYYGCPNIGDFFNKDGILIFNTVDELHNILDNLSMDLYESMREAIRDNYEKSLKTPLTNDLAYDNYFKHIIDSK